MIEITTSEDIKNMYLVKDEGVFTPLFIYSNYITETDTYTDFKIIKTAEEVYQEWLKQKDLPPQPDKIEILEGKVTALEESQVVQDFLIDDLVFEVIPALESQINASDNTAPTNVVILTDRLGKMNGGMPTYLGKKIIGGKDYKEVFKINAYKQYQDEVDTILESKGKGGLIKRGILG